jgi:hypothetical protein
MIFDKHSSLTDLTQRSVSRYSPAMREVRKRSYDIMKFNLEKRLSDAELPIAGLFLWALVHGLELLLLMAESCRVWLES